MSARTTRPKTAIEKYGGCGVLAALLEVFDAPYPGKEDYEAAPKLRLVHSSDRAAGAVSKGAPTGVALPAKAAFHFTPPKHSQRSVAQDMHCVSPMNRSDEEMANDRRRDQAVRIIADNEKRAQHKRTNESLLDQEALRQAAIRAGLEKPRGDV